MGGDVTMNIGAYLRVSTESQLSGFGLEVQREKVLVWAAEHGHRIVKWWTDEGLSGGDGLDVRVALGEALDAARGGMRFVVPRLDRLARDVILQESVLRDVRAMGSDIFSAVPSEQENLTDDPSDPSRKLIRVVLGAIATYEKDLITLRMKSGRQLKAARGGYAYGSPPLGMVARDGELVPDAGEQATLARIRELAGTGMSHRGIARELNSAGVAAKRAGTAWSGVTVARALRRAELAT
jgi:DNA invertase Pin-like site-specific DNA recombinase